jgi:transcriptional regulator with XRE-family HTH domain
MSDSRGHYKKEAYEQAIAFRKRGFTYSEIAKICGVSRGTVSAWLATEPFSQKIAASNRAQATKANTERLKLVNKARTAERTAQYKEILRLAETEYKHYRSSPTFVAGLTTYFAVGDMTDPHVIRLTNARPELHRFFITFALEYLGCAKETVHFWLLLYPTHDPVVCMKQWSRQTKLSVGQFYKHQVVKPRGKNKETLQFGVGNTIIGNTLLKIKLLHWIKLLEKETKN